jgi:hypothetical protein
VLTSGGHRLLVCGVVGLITLRISMAVILGLVAKREIKDNRTTPP